MYNLIKNEYNNINRIIIIGDVHGDLKRFKKIESYFPKVITE